MPTQSDISAAKRLSVLVIGHRGASHAYPENTLAAFAGAAALGADWIELDVRRLADDTVVVHHDPQLPDGRVLVELRAGDLPADIPTLADALATCRAAGLGVNVEIKSDPREPDHDPDHRIVAPVLELLVGDDPFGQDRLRHLVTSFDPRCLATVRRLDPTVRTGQLALDLSDPARVIDHAAARGHVAINPWQPAVDAAFMALARAAGLLVYPWTTDDPQRQRELIELGVDGIITNEPDVLRAVLRDAA